MVGVAVGIDDGEDGLLAQMFGDEFERGAGRLDAGEGVHHDPAFARVDEGDGGGVEAAHLIDAVHDLEEAVLRQDPGVTPEAGVHRIGGVAVQKLVSGQVVGVALRGVAGNHRVLAGRDEAALGEFEIPAVVIGDQFACFFQRAHVSLP